jgi:MarR family transcriptional regulator, 2-MHQ and catechol-resistance regulon repressor
MPATTKKTSKGSSELVSLMFVMGRFMREKMNKTITSGRFGSMLHFETLRYIKEEGKPLMRDVARHFRITPPAATLLIDGLVKEKFLTRIVDPKDRRAVRITLTPQGKKIIARGIMHRIKELKKIFAGLTASEQAQLTAILRKITNQNR